MGLAEEARKAAQCMTEEEYVRLLVRRDADGLAAASVLAIALDREGVDLHATFAWELLEDDLRRLDEERPAVLVTVGLGADVLPDLARLGGRLVIVDGADSP
ncbi:MAG TPA: hypothetical protein VI997_09235, partial [Candidatus Thermoplasmatota archaeon]|nr:hypothetical protein [Candidatus Thermoplasmatota archaeon]